jgi:hypothetical protein
MTVPHSRSLGLLAHIGREHLIRTASCLLGLLNVSERFKFEGASCERSWECP